MADGDTDQEKCQEALKTWAEQAASYALQFDRGVLTIAAGTLAVMGNVLLSSNHGPVTPSLIWAGVFLTLAIVAVLVGWLLEQVQRFLSSWALGRRARGMAGYRYFEDLMEADNRRCALCIMLRHSWYVLLPGVLGAMFLVVGLVLLFIHGLSIGESA